MRLVRSDEPLLSDEEIAALDAELEPPEGCIPFESRATRFPWFDRVDPFALGFGAHIQHTWHVHSSTAWRRELGPRGPMWRVVRVPSFTPLPRQLSRAEGGKLERVVSVLASWRVATAQQLSCYCAVPQKKLDHVIRAMFAAGLLERGSLVAAYEGFRSPLMYRLRKGKELAAYLDSLGPERKAAITMGQEPGSGGHDRHDLLATEIALRASETMPTIQGVLGERLAGANNLLADSPKTSVRGDFIIVRADGLRVVFEITTQPRIAIVGDKMARWGRLLGERGGVDETGVVVVFLAANYDPLQGRLDSLKKNFDKVMTPPGLGTPGQPAPAPFVHAARSSVFVASCDEWFPARWFISQRFADLRVHFSLQQEDWGEVPLIRGTEEGVRFRPVQRIDWHYLEKVRDRLYAVPPFVGGGIAQRAAAIAS